MKMKVALTLFVFFLSTFDQVDAFGGILRGISAKNRALHPQGKNHTKIGTDRSCLPLTMEATKKCLAEYYKNYDFEITKMDADKFIAAVDKIWRAGKQGVGVVCQNTRKLDACLDKIFDFETCQNADAYADIMGISHEWEDPNFYYLDNVRLRFECAHEDVLLANYDCMLRAEDKHEEEENNCTMAFELDFECFEDDWCSAGKSLARCLWTIYWNECKGPGMGDDSWFTIFCNRVQMPFLIECPYCEPYRASCEPWSDMRKRAGLLSKPAKKQKLPAYP